MNYLHFTASEISADDITAPISPHRTSPLAKFTAFALHRRQITPPCKSPLSSVQFPALHWALHVMFGCIKGFVFYYTVQCCPAWQLVWCCVIVTSCVCQLDFNKGYYYNYYNYYY